MSELNELFGEPDSSMSMVHTTVDLAMPLPLAPPLESSETLAFVERESLDDANIHSTEVFRQVVSVANEVVASGALAPGDFFPKKLCKEKSLKSKIMKSGASRKVSLAPR
jgi:hypothetical protein